MEWEEGSHGPNYIVDTLHSTSSGEAAVGHEQEQSRRAHEGVADCS